VRGQRRTRTPCTPFSPCGRRGQGDEGAKSSQDDAPDHPEPAWHQSRIIPAITENHVHPGCAGVSNREPRTKNQEPRTTCPLGARASRPHARNPARTRSAGVPNREPGTRNREPRASWVRGRPARMHAIPARCRVRGRPARMRAILRVPGVRASRTENQEPRTENHVHPGCAGVSPAYAQSCACWERGRPEPRTKNQEPRTTCILGAQASRPHTRNPAHAGSAGVPNREPGTRNREPHAPWVRGRLARMGATPARAGCAGVPPACARPRRVPGARASCPNVRSPSA
jgi:hypothetical protein